MTRIGIAVLLAAILAGCAGTETIRVVTVPDGAELRVNGEYVGPTPRSVPFKYVQFWPGWWGGTVHLRMSKEGFKDVEKAVTDDDVDHRWRSGDYTVGSEFGPGHTYTYTFHLEPAK